VPMYSLPWAWHKRWTPIALMGCVYMQWQILIIEGCDNPSHIQSTMEKDGEDNWKVRKASQIISQMPTSRPEHDKIRTQWISNNLSKNMLEKVWWCKCSKMESWNWTICCPMNCSKGKRHVRVGDGKRLQVTLRCCWKGKMLLSTCVKASRRKGRWSTINLVIMMEATRA
jgi:hypothetical protein